MIFLQLYFSCRHNCVMRTTSKSDFEWHTLPCMKIVYVNDGYGKEVINDFGHIRLQSGWRNACAPQRDHATHTYYHFDEHFFFRNPLRFRTAPQNRPFFYQLSVLILNILSARRVRPIRTEQTTKKKNTFFNVHPSWMTFKSKRYTNIIRIY